MRQIAARASLDRPRAWRHCLYAPDQDAAQAIARPLARTGWEAEIWAPEAGDECYCVIAERAVILTAELVRSSREMFEQVASLMPGAVYDGWEVAIGQDEFLEPAASRIGQDHGGSSLIGQRRKASGNRDGIWPHLHLANPRKAQMLWSRI